MTVRAKRTATVIRKQALSPHFIRIVLGGSGLADFPEGFEGGYIKLVLPPQAGSEKPCLRSYTIRDYSLEACELTVDFACHGEGDELQGPASQWAATVAQGDTVTIDGPGAVQRLDAQADWVLIAGDMTALPAISVNLEHLPSQAKGYAVIEVLSEDDKVEIPCPEQVELHWVVNPLPAQPNTCLADAVKALPWLPGTPSIWLASEFETMRNLRRYYKQEKSVDRQSLYVSSYWKMGETDEGNKAAKKRDAEAEAEI